MIQFLCKLAKTFFVDTSSLQQIAPVPNKKILSLEKVGSSVVKFVVKPETLTYVTLTDLCLRCIYESFLKEHFLAPNVILITRISGFD